MRPMNQEHVWEYAEAGLWIILTAATCVLLNRIFDTFWRDTNTMLDAFVGAVHGVALAATGYMIGRRVLSRAKSHSMSLAEVETVLGPPQTSASDGKRLLYLYKDMTVEFQNGRVATFARRAS